MVPTPTAISKTVERVEFESPWRRGPVPELMQLQQKSIYREHQWLHRRRQSLTTTLQLQELGMHHWPVQLQLQRQRALQRRMVIVGVVAVAMEWPDPAVAVVGAVAGEVDIAAAV